MELNRCKETQVWNDFVSLSEQGSVFCKTDFLDSLDVSYELWFVEEKSIPKVGAVILKDDSGQPIRQPYSFSPYLGLLFDSNITKLSSHKKTNISLKLLEFMLASLGNIYNSLSFCLAPEFEDLRGLLWFHYHQPELGQFNVDLNYTGLINLLDYADFEEYLMAISKSKRYEYRKAEKLGLTIEKSRDINLLEELYLLTFERQDLSVTEKIVKLMRSIIEAALENNYGELFICRDIKNKAISATFFLYSGSRAYYLIGANHPDYRQSGCGTYLLLENIRHYQSHGIENVDVCGINSPSRGGFKTSLNAIPTPYFIVAWDANITL